MGFFRSHAEHAKNQLENIADYADNLAEVTKNFACEVWLDYPDYITQNKLLPISMVRNFMSNLCTPNNPSEPTVPPGCESTFHVWGTFFSKNISAGGCDVTAYWRTRNPVNLDLFDNINAQINAGNQAVLIDRNGTEYQLGRILTSDYEDLFVRNISSTNRIFFRDANDTCLNITVPAYGTEFEQTKLLEIATPDPSCEDVINYPVTTPPTIISKTVQIGTEVNQTQTIEIVNNFGENSFAFPLTVNIGGQVNVTLDLGGFTFDSGGGNPEGQGGNGDNADIPDVITPTPPIDVDTTSKQPFVPDDFVEVKPTDNPDTPEVEDEEVEEIEVEDTLVRWVLVEVTTLPHQGKTILQTNSANNDYFAGYFHWEVTTPTGKWKMPALPIRKERNAFLAPTEAIGYSAYAINGAKIKLTQYNQTIAGE